MEEESIRVGGAWAAATTTQWSWATRRGSREGIEEDEETKESEGEEQEHEEEKKEEEDEEYQGEEESENGQVLGEGFYKVEDIRKKRGFVCSL